MPNINTLSFFDLIRNLSKGFHFSCVRFWGEKDREAYRVCLPMTLCQVVITDFVCGVRHTYLFDLNDGGESKYDQTRYNQSSVRQC
jgi:hypothetical protein